VKLNGYGAGRSLVTFPDLPSPMVENFDNQFLEEL